MIKMCWPVGDTLTLEALPTAVPSARAHARTIVGEWAMADMAEDVTLIVSELVANAVVASGDADRRPAYTGARGGLPAIYLRLWSDRTCIVIEVWDPSPRSPQPRQHDPDAENGRGLLLVEALSARWGWSYLPGRPGKVVWAECATPRAS
jgi:anti-sigma regulatory factor (Ser/Thr protein kinase)